MSRMNVSNIPAVLKVLAVAVGVSAAVVAVVVWRRTGQSGGSSNPDAGFEINDRSEVAP